MKTFTALLLFCLTVLSSRAETSPPETKLTGIINIPGFQCCLLEYKPSSRAVLQLALKEGQRDGDVEVSRIDPQTETVEIHCGDRDMSLKFERDPNGNAVKPAENSPAFYLHFREASLGTVLDIYAHLKQRTLLRHPGMKAKSISLKAVAQSEAVAGAAIEMALRELGIETIPDGEKFIMVVPNLLTNKVSPGSSKLASPPSAASQSDNEVIPAGMMDFRATPLVQVMMVYADFTGRKLMNRDDVPLQFITFKTETALTRAETVYALDALFNWSGIKTERDDHTMRVVPAPR